MAKLWNRFIRNLMFKNAPSGSSSRSTRASINRDPKSIKVGRVGYQLVNGGGNAGRDNFQEPLADLNLIDTAIQTDSYINQTMMKYSELIFKSGWYFRSRNEQALEYLRTRLAVMSVATGIPTEELLQGIANDVVRYSNSFLVKARARKGIGIPPGMSLIPIPPAKEPIAGYFRLPPQSIKIARDEKGEILAYQQEIEGSGNPITFQPQDIVHITINRPVGRPFGEPWIAPVLEDVRLLRKVEENAALLLYRHLFPLLTYTIGIDKPGYESTPEEIEEMQSVIENMPADGTLVLPERHKVDSVKMNTIDGRPYLDYFEQRVFTGLGMSAVDMGRGDTANRNTADAMTGIKADRVKGWQKELQTQIDHFIIDELLAEGGFDPLVNPDFNVDFVFEEIEQERKISKENHAIMKWNSNLATFEETRVELGLDPAADESRLMAHMIGNSESKTQSEVDNKNAPENQHGKRQGPKSKTESVAESSVFNHISTENIQHLYQSLKSIYSLVEKDTLDLVELHTKKRAFPVKDPTEWLSSMSFGKEQMLRHIKRSVSYALSEGLTKAKEDYSRQQIANINIGQAIQVVNEYALDSLNRLDEFIRKHISVKLKNANCQADALSAVKSIFITSEYRLKFLSQTILAKTFNYAYALAAMKYNEKQVRPVYEGGCSHCQEKARELISLDQFQSFDEIAIFYRIPPWHPNCECILAALEGGE